MKETHSMKLEKGMCLMITKAAFNDFAKTNNFSDTLQAALQNIASRCFNAKADAVIFFLNHLTFDYQCDSFMPLFKDKETFMLAPDIGDEGTIVCVRPYIGDDFLHQNKRDIDDVLHKIFRNQSNWTKEYLFRMGDDTMPIGVIDLNPYRENPSSYISRNLLSSLESELQLYREITETRPEYKRYLYDIVRDIEQVRKEIDNKEGFTQLQMEAHDFAIRIAETDLKKGTVFDGNLFAHLKSVIDICIDKITPYFKNEYNLGITAVGYGSTTLFIDIIPSSKERNTEQAEKIKKETKEVSSMVKNILKESQVLVQKSSASDDNKLDAFLEKTKLEPETAAGIIQKLESLFPKNTTTYENIDVHVQLEEPAVISFSKENMQSFGNVKRTILEQTKEEFESEISGLLGAVEVWNKEEPKFKIKTDTGKRKTICYKSTPENEEKVKRMIGKNVKIRISQEGKSNMLEQWL